MWTMAETLDLGYRQESLGKVAEPIAKRYQADAAQLSHDIDKLEKQMHEHARNLEFEQAAALRDEVKRLRELLITA
jgi:Helicase subunit of the DNA excision repair complex